MRSSVIIGAAGNSAWIPLIDDQIYTSVVVSGYPSFNGNFTWAVQYGQDNIQSVRSVSGSQTTTALVVNDTGPAGSGHGLSVGDSVIVVGSGTGVDGTYAVTSVASLTQYTLTVGVSQTATLSPQTRVASVRVFNHATLTGLIARGQGTLVAPVTCVRAVVSAYSAGNLELQAIQAIR